MTSFFILWRYGSICDVIFTFCRYYYFLTRYFILWRYYSLCHIIFNSVTFFHSVTSFQCNLRHKRSSIYEQTLNALYRHISSPPSPFILDSPLKKFIFRFSHPRQKSWQKKTELLDHFFFISRSQGKRIFYPMSFSFLFWLSGRKKRNWKVKYSNLKIEKKTERRHKVL